MTFDQFLNSEFNNMLNDLDALCSIPSISKNLYEDAPFGKEALSALKAVKKIALSLGLNASIYHNRMAIIDLYDAPFPKVCILAHADVVPDGNGWVHQPFRATLDNGIIYGRGVIDNKGPIISALYSLAYIKKYCKFKSNIRLLVGSDEEKGSEDLKYYMDREKLPMYVFTPDANYPVINIEKGRATGAFKKIFKRNDKKYVISAEGGTVINAVPDRAYAKVFGYTLEELTSAKKQCDLNVEFEFNLLEKNIYQIVAKGKSAHASLPEGGENSVTALCEFLSKIDDNWKSICKINPHGDIYGEAMKINFKDEKSGPLTYALDIISYQNNNFTGCFDIRFPICLDKDKLYDILSKVFKEHGFIIDNFIAKNPHYTDEASPLVQALIKVYSEVTKKPAKALAVGGGTYAHDIDGAVAFGPELPNINNNIHGAEEFISVDHMKLNTTLIYKALTELDNI